MADYPRITDLISDDFIRKHSQFSSLTEFFQASPSFMTDGLLTDEPQEPAFEAFVRSGTGFDSWGELVIAALFDYLARTYD